MERKIKNNIRGVVVVVGAVVGIHPSMMATKFDNSEIVRLAEKETTNTLLFIYILEFKAASLNYAHFHFNNFHEVSNTSIIFAGYVSNRFRLLSSFWIKTSCLIIG